MAPLASKYTSNLAKIRNLKNQNKGSKFNRNFKNRSKRINSKNTCSRIPEKFKTALVTEVKLNPTDVVYVDLTKDF